MSLRVQPLVAVVGSSENLKKIMVSVDDILYEIPTILKAMDICFKVHFVFDAAYSIECEQVWTFLQQAIYRINTPTDKKIKAVINLVEKFSQL